MSIKYIVYENNMNKNVRFSAKTIMTDSFGSKDIIKKMLEAGSTITEPDIVAVFEVFSTTVEQLLREGKRVNFFDIIHLYPVISGTFNNIHEKYCADKHKIKIKSSPGKRLRNIKFNNEEIINGNFSKPAPNPISFKDIKSNTENLIVSSNNIGVISGRNLKVNIENEDEGVFLINQNENSVIRISKFQKNSPKQLVFLTPDLKNDEIYQIEVRSRLRRVKDLTLSDWKIKIKSG